MHSSTWKRREREAAKLFGSLRQIGSGSLGRAGRSTSDSIHERLYVEVKCRPDHAVRGLLAAHAMFPPTVISSRGVPAVRVFRGASDTDGVYCFRSADLAGVDSFWRTWSVVRPRDAMLTLMDGTAPKAEAEGKLPVLMLAANHRKGFVACVRHRDMDEFKAIITKLRSHEDAG